VTATLPEVISVGPGRLTAGLDRMDRLDLAAHQAVFGPTPKPTAAELIGMAESVDLCGRGGAAFPVARKLRAVLVAAQRRKRTPVIVINGTEGEPGSAKDKMLLLRSPYLVLAGAVIAARALGAKEIVVGMATGGAGAHIRSVGEAVAADASLRKMVRIVAVPDRFVSGESGALVNAINGKGSLPPGRKTRASDSGVGGQPTYLSNAETFAQIAVLSMLGPEGYATAGTPDEPGTTLLSVGGSARHPAVVEVPLGAPLGHVLGICDAQAAEGVLVGGYHGMWLTAEAAATVPVSRAGMAAAGGSLGAGIVLPLGAGTCPLGEVARVAAYLAKESSGQCGPCMLGLPAIARSLAALAQGSGGVDAMDTARRAAASVRGRGACAHPDGVFRFVVSALDVFTDDLAAHLFRGSCGRPTRGVLPLSQAGPESRLTVDWTRCRGHGLCAYLVPELVQLDGQGFPEFLDVPVPFWLARQAEQAVEMCPALALSLVRDAPPPPPGPVAIPTPRRRAGLRAGGAPALEPPRKGLEPGRKALEPGRRALEPGRKTVPSGRKALEADRQDPADTVEGLVVTEAWISQISGYDDRGGSPPGYSDRGRPPV
jgi:NADH:ubiquinone oxidoreductase subunit F (NADH-binding)/ferredoxin